MSAAAPNSNLAWPQKGTPEYEDRLARMRAGHQKRAEAARTKREPAPAINEPEIIDVGEPTNARMAPEPRPEKGKPGKGGGSKGKGDIVTQAEVHRHIKLACEGLAKMGEGHEHWHKDDDEIELVAEPATRIINRLDPKILEQMRKVSDPVALIMACGMVFGPSILEEVRHFRAGAVQSHQKPGSGQRAQAQHPPAGRHSGGSPHEAADGPGGYPFANTAPISGNGASPTAPIEGLPDIGI